MIGVFDSGSGGLTVLLEIRNLLPSVDVVYFGDIKNAPYGVRPQEELSQLTVAAIQRLRERGATKIVSACNSVSASLALSIFDISGIESKYVVEMVGPTVSYFKDSEDRVLLCATPATVRSGIYQNAFKMIGKDIAVVPIPDLAGAIEFGASSEEKERIIAEAFVLMPQFDTLILGCTHYPFEASLFKKVLPDVVLFDPAVVVAQRTQKLFGAQEVGTGATSFLISKDSANFRKRVSLLFPDSIYEIEVLS